MSDKKEIKILTGVTTEEVLQELEAEAKKYDGLYAVLLEGWSQVPYLLSEKMVRVMLTKAPTLTCR